jgi:DNA-binding beta-propeller fold protein YncE
MRNRFWLIGIYVVSISGLLAQTSTLAGPRTGFVIDPASGAIRPVQGILGGATIGPTVQAGVSLAGRAVSPRGDYILAVEAETLGIWIVQPGQAAAPVSGVMRAADRIATSPAGSHAVLFKADSARLEVLKGLPATPAVDREVDLSALPGSLSALAVSEDGATVLAAVAGPSGGFVYRIAGQGITLPLFPLSRVSAMAFSSRGDAAIADAGSNTAWLIRDAAGAANVMPLAGQNEGVDAPVGIAISEDGAAAYVANAGSNAVLILNLAGGAPRTLPCPCAPTTLQAISATAFRLTDALSEALWFLDTSGAEPGLAFVPPPQPPEPNRGTPQRPGRVY